MIARLAKDICEGCDKGVGMSHRLLVCDACSKTCHFKCKTTALFHLFKASTAISNAIWYCNNCIESHGVIRYNPFSDMLSPNTIRNDDEINYNASLQHMYEVLEFTAEVSKLYLNLMSSMPNLTKQRISLTFMFSLTT